ncbi:MAG: helix-turn-helix domain-containing protein [Candidatus Marsarchaeota archaeon]|nr:helix-turn-helix domain-containing protein [Candidatus Marsarchaeota archaeon]
MNTILARRRQIIESLKDKGYRDLSVAASIRNGLAFQIRAMRENRGWTQVELGEKMGMAQETISLLEDPNYGRFTVKTLKRLASAFDVSLTVRFDPFSEFVAHLINLSPSDLAVPSFNDDQKLREPSSNVSSSVNLRPLLSNSTGSIHSEYSETQITALGFADRKRGPRKPAAC